MAVRATRILGFDDGATYTSICGCRNGYEFIEQLKHRKYSSKQVKFILFSSYWSVEKVVQYIFRLTGTRQKEVRRETKQMLPKNANTIKKPAAWGK